MTQFFREKLSHFDLKTYRVHLSRLRCGHHPGILSYEHHLRPDTDPFCCWCRGPSESVDHLFSECPASMIQISKHEIRLLLTRENVERNILDNCITKIRLRQYKKIRLLNNQSTHISIQ